MSSIVLNGYVYAGLGTNGVNFSDWWVYDKYLSALEQQINQSTISVYPNPSSKYFQLDLNLADNFELNNTLLQLINSKGKVVKNTVLTQSNTRVNTTDLNAGTYYYSINYKDTKLKTGKLIITK